MNKTLIIYYSQSGQSKRIVQLLQEKIDADTFEIEPVRSYNMDMWKAWDEAQEEMKTGILPELKVYPNLGKYQTVIIGGPVWGMTLANPLKTFMMKTDFAGKIVSAFWTFYDHDENYNADSRKFAEGAEYREGLSLPRSITGNTKLLHQALDKWVDTIK